MKVTYITRSDGKYVGRANVVFSSKTGECTSANKVFVDNFCDAKLFSCKSEAVKKFDKLSKAFSGLKIVTCDIEERMVIPYSDIKNLVLEDYKDYKIAIRYNGLYDIVDKGTEMSGYYNGKATDCCVVFKRFVEIPKFFCDPDEAMDDICTSKIILKARTHIATMWAAYYKDYETAVCNFYELENIYKGKNLSVCLFN